MRQLRRRISDQTTGIHPSTPVHPVAKRTSARLYGIRVDNPRTEIGKDEEIIAESHTYSSLIMDQVVNEVKPSSNLKTSVICSSKEDQCHSPFKVIKAEDDFLSNLYNVSPRGYCNKTSHLIKRDSSKSIAQLSARTACRLASKVEDQKSIAEEVTIKSERDEGDFADGKAWQNGSTLPASSPIPYISAIKRQKHVPFNLRQYPKKTFPSPMSNQESVDTYIFNNESPTGTRKRKISGELNNSSSDEHERRALQETTIRTQTQSLLTNLKNTKNLVQPELPPVLLPVKIQKPSWRTTADLAPVAPSSSNAATSKHVTAREISTAYHSIGNPKTPKNQTRFRITKPASICPSIASSFGPNDDIPSSKDMREEAIKTIIDSTKKCVTKQLSGVSLRRRDLQTSLPTQNDRFLRTKEKNKDTFTGYECDGRSESLAQRSTLHKNIGQKGDSNEKFVKVQQQSLRMGSRVMQTKGKIPQPTSRPRLDLPRALGMFERIPRNDEKGWREYLYFSEDEDSLDKSRSHDSSLSAAEVHHGGSFEGPYDDHRVKRVRMESLDWHSGLFIDNEMQSDEDITEIGKEDFEKFEKNKTKKPRTIGQLPREPAAVRLEPESEKDVDQNEPFAPKKEHPTAIIINENENNQRIALTPCEYTVHSYFEHGQSSEGLLARNGLISYREFKKYCEESSQPTKDAFLRFKKDLKHHSTCTYHQHQRPDLLLIACFVEENPGFSFSSCHPYEDVRRRENAAIGNAPKSPAHAASPAVDHAKLEALQRESELKEVLIAELMTKLKDVSASVKRTKRIIGAKRKPARETRRRI